MFVKAINKHGCFFFNNRHVSYEECWFYIGPAYWIKGYPIIKRHNKNWIASRFVWYFITGRDYIGKIGRASCRERV